MNENNKIISNPRQTLVELLSEATIELFAENGLNLSSKGETQEISMEGTHLIALIGLSSESIRVSLALLAPQHLLKNTFPMDIGKIDDKLVQDWAGELSNHLAGHLKHKLLPYGCNLKIGLPIVIQGDNMQIDQPKNTVSSKHQFVTEKNELIEVDLNTLLNEDFILHIPEETDESDLQEEDEILFF